jgi:DNA-binding NtrC family response regulator
LNQGQPICAAEIRLWLGGGETRPGDERSLPLGLTLDEVERRLIVATLERFDGHRGKTAEALGIGVRTLSGKLRNYGFAPREKDFAEAS